MNAAEYAAKVGDIFVLPDTCLRIKQIIDNKISDLDEIAELISLDPSLASRLLKLANSALYNFPHQVDSVSKAVLLLGEVQVYNLVVAYGATEAFSSVKTQAIDLERFWEQSIHCALIAKFLGQRLGIKPQEPLYLSGLLHNIGELVVAEVTPAQAAQCQQLSPVHVPSQIQQKVLGFTFVDCSLALMQIWQLPLNIQRPLLAIHHTEFSQVNSVGLILHISAQLALLHSTLGTYTQSQLVAHQAIELLGLTAEDLTQAQDFAFLEGLAIMSLLNPSASMLF